MLGLELMRLDVNCSLHVPLHFQQVMVEDWPLKASIKLIQPSTRHEYGLYCTCRIVLEELPSLKEGLALGFRP